MANLESQQLATWQPLAAQAATFAVRATASPLQTTGIALPPMAFRIG
jgi:hypothetical protein